MAQPCLEEINKQCFEKAVNLQLLVSKTVWVWNLGQACVTFCKPVTLYVHQPHVIIGANVYMVEMVCLVMIRQMYRGRLGLFLFLFYFTFFIIFLFFFPIDLFTCKPFFSADLFTCKPFLTRSGPYWGCKYHSFI